MTIFEAPVTARYVRISPQTWEGSVAMRAGVILVSMDECTEACSVVRGAGEQKGLHVNPT